MKKETQGLAAAVDKMWESPERCELEMQLMETGKLRGKTGSEKG